MDGENLEMKKIEESDLRQVSLSKRRNVILKKAHELTILCDANVSIIIMCSSTNELHEYVSPTTTMKNMIDQYQMTLGVDLWSTHYEQMQENWRSLMDVNNALRRDIMRRRGEELDDLNMEQLCSLEEDMLKSLELVRQRKYRVISNQTDIYRKKVRWSETKQLYLLRDLEAKYEFPHGLVVNEGGYYTAVANESGS